MASLLSFDQIYTDSRANVRNDHRLKFFFNFRQPISQFFIRSRVIYSICSFYILKSQLSLSSSTVFSFERSPKATTAWVIIDIFYSLMLLKIFYTQSCIISIILFRLKSFQIMIYNVTDCRESYEFVSRQWPRCSRFIVRCVALHGSFRNILTADHGQFLLSTLVAQRVWSLTHLKPISASEMLTEFRSFECTHRLLRMRSLVD